ncbi:MAG: TolC family protein [Gammaproteobacteria bacterium]|nr:TolC family protein [Gammaproteobacteria bacterium]
MAAAGAAEQFLTLEAAVKKTLRQNPQLHQFAFTRERLLAEREVNALKPGYELGMVLENVAGTGDTSGFDSAEITVALSSVIELGEKRESRVSVVDARLDRFDLERQAQTLDVLGEVTSAFIQLLTTQEELELSSEAISLAESLHTTVQERAKRGAASDAEVMRAKAMFTQSQIRQESVRQKLERQKVSLARYWGETTVSYSLLDGDLFTFGSPLNFAELYHKVKASPAINVFASEMRLREAEVRLAKTQNRADLNWQFGVKRLEDSDDTAFTLGFSMPLFAEQRNRGRVNAALAESNAVAYQRSDRLLALHDRLFSAFSQRQQFIAAHQLLKEQIIPDLERALSITRQAYDRGRLKYQDWIAAQQELLGAKQQMIETASAALLNQAVIEQLTAEALTK